MSKITQHNEQKADTVPTPCAAELARRL
jgi:predicted AAA+ superfamily ATPase